MNQLSRREFTAVSALFCLAPMGAMAKPVSYTLDKAASSVGFTFALSGARQTGTMPIQDAKIRIDPDNLVRSSVDVTLNVAKAKTGLIFATDALKSADVLDAKQFPYIRFVSTRVQLADDGRLSGDARLSGDLTIRNVTRPTTFAANLYRATGSAADDLSRLSVRLRGSISRKAFGASGYSGMVDDTVTLDITAAIRAT